MFKKPRKPLYFKKSKAAKEAEKEMDVYSVAQSETPRNYHRRPEGRAENRGGRRERYNKEYEYSGYEDQYDGEEYPYDDENRDMYNEKYEYTTEESRYRRRPRRNQSYTMTDTVYSEEESESEMYERYRGGDRRQREESAYSSEYDFRDRRPRRREGRRRNQHLDMSETERNPYKNDFNVYVAHQPVGHRAFTYKQQQEQEEQASNTSWSESETDGEYDSSRDMKRQQYHVYAAQTGHNQTEVFGQKQGREKVFTLPSYNGNVQMMAFKDKKHNKVPHRVQSGVVYLPVLVKDNKLELPHSQTMSLDLLKNKIGEKAEKPLENNTQVYVATDMEQGNIFQQEQKRIPEENNEIQHVENITIYTMSDDQPNLLPKKRSTASVFGKKGENKANPTQSDYPVQKSYINVAPSRLKSISKKKSKHEIKPSESRISVVENTRYSNNPRPSSFFSRIRRKSSKIKNEHKIEEDDNNSEILSVVNLTTGESDKEEKKSLVNTTPAIEPPLLSNKSLLSNKPGVEANRRKSVVTKEKVKSKQENQESIYQSEPNIQPEREEIIKPSSEPLQTRESYKRESSTIKENVGTEKSKSSSKLFRRKKKDPPNRASETPDIPVVASGSRYLLNDISENSDPNTLVQTASPIDFAPRPIDIETLKVGNLKTTSSIKKQPKKSTVEFSKQNLNGRNVQNNPPLQIWGYDVSFLIYMFQAAQFFLGLSIHDKLIEVLRTFQRSDT